MQNFEPVPIGELSEEISMGIRESIAERYRNNGTPEMTEKNISIVKYLGCYKGYYAFRFTNNLIHYPNETWGAIYARSRRNYF